MFFQGGHQPGKPGKVGELTVVVREKSGKVEKVRENVFCLWCVTAVVMITE